MSVTFRPCVLIPCYNHGAMMASVLARLAPFDLPCLVVDDGSDETTRRTLEALAADRPQVTLLRLAENSGKGAAVMQGLKACADRGFTAVKMNGTEELQFIDTHDKVDAVLERVQAIRDEMGPNFGIGVDFHGRVHRPMAKVLARELDPFKLMFIEEPVLSEHAEALKEIANHTATPIALGERLFSRWDFKNILHAGYVDIIQPDPSHAGGITETRKIAAMAEAYDIALALHCPLGPIALAANLQLDAVCYNAFIQEQSLGIHYNTTSDLLDYLKDPSVFEYRDGHVAIPQGPGLGIEVDEDFVRKAAETGHRWRNPVWRHKDGSFAEW